MSDGHDHRGTRLCLTGDQLRRRRSLKWSRVAAGEFAADIAELDFAPAEAITTGLEEYLAHGDLGYPDFTAGTSQELRVSYCDRMRRRHGWRPDPGRVEFSGQIIQALCCAILAYTSPGDVVVTHTPTYRPIVEAITGLGRRCHRIPVRDLDNVDDLRDQLPAQMLARTRLLVLCHPHNPTGHVFSESTLRALGHFAAGHQAVIFSDEIYQDLVWPPAVFRSAASVGELAPHTAVFTSAAKSHNIGGLRCAVGHFGSEALHTTYTALPWHLRDGASLLGIAATIAAWRHGDDWLSDVRAQVQENLAMTRQRLSALDWRPPPSAFFAWLDFTGTRLSGDPRAALGTGAGVWLQAGASFGPEFTSWARLNVATCPDRLDRLLRRIAEALGEVST